MSKEKYLSESALKDTPKQRFSIKIRDGSVTTDKVADKAITSPKLADDSITTSKIADNTITKEKLTSDVLDAKNIKYSKAGSSLGSDNVQDAIDEIVDDKFDKTSVVQSIGQSESKVMSQKAVTDELKDIHDTTDNIISVMVKNGFNIDLTSSKGWSFRYRAISESNSDGTYKAFTTLSAEAKFYALDVTDKITGITWTRDTGDAEADAAWNKAHTSCGLSIPISYPDLGGNVYQIGHANFTCTAEYNAEGDMYVAQKTVSF